MSDDTCLYVAMQRDNPDCVKIGLSCAPDRRAREIPGDVVMVHTWVVSGVRGDAYRVEQCAHALLAASRDRLEWFNVTATEAAQVIYKAAKLLAINLTPGSLPRVRQPARGQPAHSRQVFDPPRPWSETVDRVCREFGITHEQLQEQAEQQLTLYKEVHKAMGLKGSKQP